MNRKTFFSLVFILITNIFPVYGSESANKLSIVKNTYSSSVNYYGEPSACWVYNDREAISNLQRYLKIQAKDRAAYLVVQYIVPNRDRGGYSEGGANATAYRSAVERIATMIGNKAVIIIVEPDELCFDNPNYQLIKLAVEIYRQRCKNIKIFIDAGHPNWLKTEEVTSRLSRAGIQSANGFSINTSSFNQTKACINYGDIIVRSFPGKKYIIDTSRNGGRNPKYPDIFDPEGIRVGIAPTFNTGNPNCFAFLWIKPPGESDGRVAPAGTFVQGLVGK